MLRSFTSSHRRSLGATNRKVGSGVARAHDLVSARSALFLAVMGEDGGFVGLDDGDDNVHQLAGDVIRDFIGVY